MLKRSIKRNFGFFEIFARNKKFEFFGQLLKSILQSVNGDEKLTNELLNLVISYVGKISKLVKILLMRCLRGPLKEFLGFLKFSPELRNLSFLAN